MIPEMDYAFYVWTSYGLFGLIIAWQFVQPRWRRARIMAELREEVALTQGDYNDPHA